MQNSPKLEDFIALPLKKGALNGWTNEEMKKGRNGWVDGWMGRPRFFDLKINPERELGLKTGGFLTGKPVESSYAPQPQG